MYTSPVVSGELGRSDAIVHRNSFSRSAPYLAAIDGIKVDDLVKDFGSPLFVFSERTIIDTARRAKKAFKEVYPNTVFGWSYKTNYLAAICNIFHKEGWIAEVVSDFEYQKARKSGIKGKDIIYNGPHKSFNSLTTAMTEGALVQIDNWDELETVEAIASTLQHPINVGIRVWMDTKHAPVWAKFGFEFECGEAARAARRIVEHKHLRLHTLHCHIGTYVLEPKAYAVAAMNLSLLRQSILADTGHLCDAINLGGGFPSESLMHGMPENTKIPPIEEYAKAIAGVLNQWPKKERPQLRLELGRHLIDNAGYLITSVVTVKGTDKAKGDRSQRARGGYITDAGVHLLYTATWFKVNVMPTKPSNPQIVDNVKLYGCLCMNIDTIREDVDLPPLEVKDKLVLYPVGAYNLTQSMQFIGLRPAVVLIGTDKFVSVIRRREELKDLDGAEEVPSHLRIK